MDAFDPGQALLRYESELLGAASEAEAAFVAVNRLGILLPYRLAVLLRPDPVRHARVAAVSNLHELDENAPLAQWLARLVRSTGDADSSTLGADTVTPELAAEWGEWLPEQAVVCRLKSPAGVPLGWLVVGCERSMDPPGIALLQLAARKIALVLGAWTGRGWFARWRQRPRMSRKALAGVAAAVLAVLLVPVRLSALAPAEVTPLQPAAVTAPVEGVLSRFLVAPNTLVNAGDVVAAMDDTVLRNRHAVALKGLEIARAEFARAGSKAFGDDQSRADLLTLKARIDEKQAEVAYTEDLLARIQLRAPVAGLVIYSNPDEWIGRTVSTGERIATVADPARAGLTVHLPPGDAIPVEAGAAVRFFQNVAPLSSLDGRLTQVGYEAENTVDAGLAFVLKAEFERGTEPPRLGQRGTAKVYGERVPLAYYLLRRPIGALRRLAGL